MTRPKVPHRRIILSHELYQQRDLDLLRLLPGRLLLPETDLDEELARVVLRRRGSGRGGSFSKRAIQPHLFSDDLAANCSKRVI